MALSVPFASRSSFGCFAGAANPSRRLDNRSPEESYPTTPPDSVSFLWDFQAHAPPRHFRRTLSYPRQFCDLARGEDGGGRGRGGDRGQGVRGRGEGVPYARYGETVDSVLAQMGSVRSAIEAGADRGPFANPSAPWRRTQRHRLRALGFGGQAKRRSGPYARGRRAAGAGRDRLHDFGGHSGRNGAGGGLGTRAAALKNQTRGRRRCGAARRGARRRARCNPHR